MKKLLVLVLSLAMVLSLSACGNKETKKSDSDSSKKKFAVGFDAEYPPYGYMDSDTGEYTGFDLELAQAVCDMEGWELVKTPIEWASKDAELNNGNIDCIWNGFTINGKEDKYEWSDPYVNNQQVVVVAKNSGITKLADLKDKYVAAQSASAALQLLQKGGDQEKLCGVLSGGERNRLHLAMALKEEGNVLLLDEPTNDIDVNTLRALEEGLEDFAGCAVIISHDRWFLDRICTHILAFEGDSNVFYFEGSYSEYEENKQKRLGKEEPTRVRYRKLMND